MALITAMGNWLFDYLALLAALTAVGSRPRPSLVLLSFVTAAVLGMIPLTPGGLGFVEAGLTATLTLAGVNATDAVLATLAYRLVSYWLPLVVGPIAYVLHRRRFARRVPTVAAPLLVLVVLLTGCGGARDDALLIGRLYGDASTGCVWIGNAQGGTEIDWPSLVRIEFHPLRVSGPGFTAGEGGWFRMGGGARPDIPVTPACPVNDPESGKWGTNGIEYFGNERPSSDF
jgi:hypothetical protein